MNSILEFYSRKDIQRQILLAAKDREIAVKYGDKGFGKRPDIVQYDLDILELVKQGATSFHISEEIWEDPLNLTPGMTKKQLDSLRKGWDLVLDIDSKEFEYSKILASLLIDALKFHGINYISLKFSGNAGFHIGIPSKSFPKEINNIKTNTLFPEAARVIAMYLRNIIKEPLTQKLLSYDSIAEITKKISKSENDLREKICSKCKSVAEPIKIKKYICENCSREETAEAEILVCLDCKEKMTRKDVEVYTCRNCGQLNKDELKEIELFNPFAVLDIDTILISNRHLFRSPYSFNEKSNLISIPLNLSDLNSFKREDASPDKVKIGPIFLDDSEIKIPEASHLIIQAFDWHTKTQKMEIKSEENKTKESYLTINTKIGSDYFPPCIKLIKSGLKDGKKRSLFILINFLKTCNYNEKELEEYILEWNKNNEEPLKEGYTKTQLSWHKKQKQNILPPNCSNKSYYADIGVCKPDNFCKFIKNPTQYSIKKYNLDTKSRKS